MKLHRSKISTSQFRRSKVLSLAMILTLLLVTFIALQMQAGVGVFRKAQAQGLPLLGPVFVGDL